VIAHSRGDDAEQVADGHLAHAGDVTSLGATLTPYLDQIGKSISLSIFLCLFSAGLVVISC
jgi:hypothetical protein